MITEKVFKLVSKLKTEQEFITSILRGMDSQYVRTGIGLVYHNHGIMPCDEARMFGNYFKNYIKRQDESLKNELITRLNEIEVEIKGHIISDGEQ